ncbi:class I SAM-dependent methyltransferase [Acidocella sp.]|uniref:class I SAM-dependent methyltransferase n=1 Tax=Acidocella sp. TaxID=50710 RepID=UPI003CFC92A2
MRVPSVQPERFDHFMARANAAYYARGRFGRDFTTAPEITQVFGELLGAWAKVVWQMLGAPQDIILAEAGPGRGVLMADALRVWPTPNVHFIETSPTLRAEQASRVPHANWHASLASLPPGPLILIANEFLDALPVRQFIRRDAGWMERHVANGSFIELPATHTGAALPDDPPGTVREVNEAAIEFCTTLAARDAIGLFIDYGPADSAPGDSIQAIRDGAYASPLATPGTADITAHVDFSAIKRAVHTQGPVKQNFFLTSLGLYQRSDVLARRHPGKALDLRLSVQRLTAPEAMGSLFKALAVCPAHLPPLPGFA